MTAPVIARLTIAVRLARVNFGMLSPNLSIFYVLCSYYITCGSEKSTGDRN